MTKPRLPDKNFTWTAELAYAVGLLVTDGNLAKDGRHIVFRSCDLDQVETLRICLNGKSSIEAPKDRTQYGQRVCYRIQIGDVQLYRWLLKIGLFPAKTYTIGAAACPPRGNIAVIPTVSPGPASQTANHARRARSSSTRREREAPSTPGVIISPKPGAAEISGQQ